MSSRNSRRAFLQGMSLAAVAGGWSFLDRLPRVSAEEAASAGVAPLDERIAPLVELIEESDRDEVLERVARRVLNGTSYRDVLAALLSAGVRNVQPRPSVGFKFHCVLVVNSCHLASINGPDSDRWLPIFWAIDNFKSSQADEIRRGGWRMPPVDQARVPSAATARRQWIDAFERWDEQQADAATAALVRTAGAGEVFELFAQYAARDYRSIGHKAIYLANAYRTLNVIGWRFAEPVMRSLAHALLNHSGESNPAESDHPADRPWRENEALLEKFGDAWLDGRPDPAAAKELIAQWRSASPADASRACAELVGRGFAPQTAWDAVFVRAGELLMQQPGIIGLHGLTTANAMRFLYDHVADHRLRQRLLLQACSFQPMFRASAEGRGSLKSLTVDDIGQGEFDGSIDDILADISSNPQQAATKVKAMLARPQGDATQLIDAAQRMVFLKGRDSHDYKFSSAVLEDYRHVSPEWRDSFLALSVFYLKGSGDRDSGLLERTRAALEA